MAASASRCPLVRAKVAPRVWISWARSTGIRPPHCRSRFAPKSGGTVSVCGILPGRGICHAHRLRRDRRSPASRDAAPAVRARWWWRPTLSASMAPVASTLELQHRGGSPLSHRAGPAIFRIPVPRRLLAVQLRVHFRSSLGCARSDSRSRRDRPRSPAPPPAYAAFSRRLWALALDEW